MYAQIFKANPYHDERGRFSTEDKAKTISGKYSVWHGSAAADKLVSEGYVVGHKGAGLGRDILGPGMYVTPSKDYASKFGELLKVQTSKVKMARVSKEDLYALTQEKDFQAELRKRTDDFFKTPEGKNAISAPDFKGQLISEHFLKRGYDGVFTKLGPIPALDNGMRTAIVLYSPNKVIKSLHKLKDIVEKSEQWYVVHPSILPKAKSYFSKSNKSKATKTGLSTAIELAKILKANPYHDASGRFATKDSATLVSIGGVFDKQRGRQGVTPRTPSADEQLATLRSMKHLDFFEDAEARAGLKVLHDKGVNVSDLASSWLGEGFEPNPRSKPKLRINNDGLVTFKSTGGKHFGAEVGLYRRVLFADTMTVYHDYLELKEDSQGAGAVKKMFKEVVPAYERNGVQRIELGANLDVGGYAWAKYGFSSANPKVDNPKLLGHLDRELVVHSRDSDPDALAELKSIRKVANELKDDPRLVQALADLKTPALDKGRKVSFAKRVLLNSGWRGVLDLKDAEARNRLKKYLGG